MNNVGMIAVLQKRFEEASNWFQRSMLLNREVGDSWMIALCHNNLGNATRGLGDYDAARRHYAESLLGYRDYDDQWAIAFLLEDIGVLAALSGDARSALELIGAADAMREAIGTPRPPALEQELEKHFAKAAVSLPEPERTALRARGRSLDLVAGLARAMEVCEQ
jgi:tetratricopeptide (TPR) repeat protein